MAHTILICDDSMFMRQKVKQVLDDAGFEVVGEAGAGVEAIAKWSGRSGSETSDVAR